jgi:hypothetical protein
VSFYLLKPCSYSMCFCISLSTYRSICLHILPLLIPLICLAALVSGWIAWAREPTPHSTRPAAREPLPLPTPPGPSAGSCIVTLTLHATTVATAKLHSTRPYRGLLLYLELSVPADMLLESRPYHSEKRRLTLGSLSLYKSPLKGLGHEI